MEFQSIPLSRPSLSGVEIEAAVEVLRSGNLVQGAVTADVEEKIAELFGQKFAILVSNGTAALHLSLLSLGAGPGDEVIVPAYSFIATANAVMLTGAKPIFVDVSESEINIDPIKARKKISNRTKAIIIVHEFGFTADIQAFQEISKESGIPLIEDAACAFGSEINNGPLGTFSALGCFSFHPRKIVTSGEGGLILTNNQKLANFVTSMRNHGVSSSNIIRSYEYPGYNYRITDFQSALLPGQVGRLGDIIEKRNEIASRYNLEIRNPLVSYPKYLDQRIKNWQTFPILLPSAHLADRFIKYASENGVAAIRPAQLMPMENTYNKLSEYSEEKFPEAKELWNKCLALPLFDTMTEADISRVVETVNEFK
jgi:dTDP-4-amino-4,6-dideoxygalactose transaminase